MNLTNNPDAWPVMPSHTDTDRVKALEDELAEFKRDSLIAINAFVVEGGATLDRAIAAEQRVRELEGDARRWRALLGCARLRIIGTAGFDPTNGNGAGHYRHVGLEMWTRYPSDASYKDAFDPAAILIEFADEAALAAPLNDVKETTK